MILLTLNSASLGHFNVVRELVWNGGMLIGLSVIEGIELESCLLIYLSLVDVDWSS